MSKKQEIAVRFYAEGNKNDSDTFSMPVNLTYHRRTAVLSRVPDLSEKQIDKIFPFPAKDGSWGCVFKLTSQGRLRLETMSGELRGRALVVFVTTRAGRHQVVDMIIDRPVSDGIITIPSGLVAFEVEVLKKEFKIIGAPARQNGRDKPREKPQQFPGGRNETPADRDAIYDPVPASPPARRHGGSDSPLPELLSLPRPQD
jgi:hypothetical protein